jgi:hypothetical protein
MEYVKSSIEYEATLSSGPKGVDVEIGSDGDRLQGMG